MKKAREGSTRMKRMGVRMALVFLAVLSCLSAFAQSTPPNGVAATSTPLLRPHGLAYDSAGNYYIAATDQNVIRKVSTAGIITTVAGTGEQGYAGDGLLATAAILDSPQGVAVDSSGNIYIADTHNNVIREVLALSGNIETIAGTGVAGYSGDSSTATAAMLSNPTAVAVDSIGNVYVADTNNHCIRKIIGTTIFTVAGDGEQFFSGDGGPATAAGLDSPNGVAVDSSFNIYIGDTHNQRVRMVTFATGHISTIAGSGVNGYNGEGTATAVELARPRGVAVDPSGNVYVADSDNNLMRSISGGEVNTIAGTTLEGFGGDGGAPKSAWLDTPDAVAISGSSILFSDTENNVVRELNGRVINSVAGETGPLPAITSPAPGSTLTASDPTTFTWNPGTGVAAYALRVGTTSPGSSDVYRGSVGTTATSLLVSNIPTNGVTLYVRLMYKVGETWNSIDYTYTEYGAPTLPAMITPSPGSTLSDSSATFNWSPGGGPSAFALRVGTTSPGSSDVYHGNTMVLTSIPVSGIPQNGVTLYVRLMYKISGTWSWIDYTYTEAGTPVPPAMTNPSPGSILSGSDVTFNWSSGAGPSAYALRVGTTRVGSSDVYHGNTTPLTSIPVSGIPTNGKAVYVRLMYKVDGVWHAIDYTFTEFTE